MTDRAKVMLVSCLSRLRESGEDPNLSLKQSEFHNWQGCYAVKDSFRRMIGAPIPERPDPNLGRF